jgi:hypothetical protein
VFVAAITDEPRLKSRRNTRTELETLWAEHATAPQQQALVCAEFCRTHAPHLAEWLKARIYAMLPDSLLTELLLRQPDDGRIQALNQLAQLHSAHDINPEPPVTSPSPARTKRVGGKSQKSQTSDFDEGYRAIFGVTLRVEAEEDERRLRSDPELGRLTIALRQAHAYRFWVVAQEMNRRAEGRGYIHKSDLYQQLRYYGIHYTDRQFRRILAAGQDLFWRQDRKHRERLYLVSWQQVSLKIVEQAETRGYEVGWNRPGARQQLVDVSGGLEGWEGKLYASWIGYRAGEGGLSISRVRQAALFGRSEKTIRKWERCHLQGIVTKRVDYEQHPDDLCTQEELYDRQGFIPDHAQPYTATTPGGERQRRYWRRPNTYLAVRDPHAHHGQARKVRRAVNHAISAEADGGPWRENYTAEQHRRRVKSHKFRRGEDGDVNRPVHVFIGKRGSTGVWELVVPDPAFPYPQTRPNERRMDA